MVVGAGYAGAGAVASFERAAPPGADLVWISDHDYHLVRHEVHRAIRDPAVADHITIPVAEIASPGTAFVNARVAAIDPGARAVELADGSTVGYDYLLVAVGGSTAFYGIDGLREHALTLDDLADARTIRRRVRRAAERATVADPARVIVGGAGLSGIQVAGEIAAWRDDAAAPVAVELVEAAGDVLPSGDPGLRRALGRRLADAGVGIETGAPVSAVGDARVRLGEGDAAAERPFDAFVWTGGVAGPPVLTADIDRARQGGRVHVRGDFRTSADRVFAIGDSALVDRAPDAEAVAPPTAQAAWQAAEVAGRNLARALRGEPLATWQYADRGTLVSVGERAVAHDVRLPGIGRLPVRTFGGPAAVGFKKAVACRWIRKLASTRRALAAWRYM